MIRAIFKIWPALTPILLYILWVLVFFPIFRKIFRKKAYIEGEFVEIDKKTGEKLEKKQHFSLKNPIFVAILYFSLVLLILSLVWLAFV